MKSETAVTRTSQLGIGVLIASESSADNSRGPTVHCLSCTLSETAEGHDPSEARRCPSRTNGHRHAPHITRFCVSSAGVSGGIRQAGFEKLPSIRAAAWFWSEFGEPVAVRLTRPHGPCTQRKQSRAHLTHSVM